ncbi:MAG: ATP-binding protein, partial [Draconibacterium sp.]
EFNLNAAFKDKQNRLYFGSINGITAFNPSRLPDIDKETGLMFTGISYNNNKTGNLSLHHKSQTGTIALDYNNFPLNINFTSIDVRPFKNVNFAYRILPDNKKWNHLGNRRDIQFHKLDPGSYTLEIQGIFRSKFWNSPPLSLEIHVTPPWWKSNMAITIWILLLISSIYFVYKRQIWNILTRKEADKLKEIDKLKSNFFANISHEFRTPLTIISGVSHGIKTRLPNVEKEKYLHDFDIINRNTNNLLVLVNRILDLAKLENNKLKLNPVQSDIISYLKYLSESYILLAAGKKIQLTVHAEPDELIMDFDPDSLAQVISNLLSNAIKFTPQNGSILLYAQHNEKDNTLTIKVKDTGMGMSDEVQKRIFNRFYQTAPSTQQHYGTGIGLFLAKELVKLMKGEIKVKSTINKGSCFTVQLPVTNKAIFKKEVNLSATADKRAEINIKQETEPVSNTKALLLLIEDNADVSYYIKSCLVNQYSVVLAQDGSEGVKQALSLVPDIIITDIMMPQKDGYEVCYELKNNELTDHIPIVMLTAKAGDENRIAGLTAGVDVYLEKPFNKTELLLQLEQ